MKLPPDSFIARAKITHYLLVPQARGDKSRFLGLAGYDSSLADQLLQDLHTQVLPCEAVIAERTEHGQYFEISCPLTGPNGRTLGIRTVWMKEHLSGQTKFITLIPERSHEDAT
jgi:hypothetical protein